MARVGATSPAPTKSTHGGFTDVAAVHGGPAWVVGQAELSNGAGPTVIERWNGSQWAAVASPSPGTLSNGLNATSRRSPLKDVWAVGSSAGGTLAEHWDGTSWSVFPSANGNDADNVLNGVAGTSPNDVWTVGYAGGIIWTRADPALGWIALVTRTGIVCEYWHALWDRHTDISTTPGQSGRVSSVGMARNGRLSPARRSLSRITITLFGVAAVAANDVWAVGGNPPQGCGDTSPATIEHWNGEAVVSDSQHARRDPLWSLGGKQLRCVGGRRRIWKTARHALGRQKLDRPLRLPPRERDSVASLRARSMTCGQ